MNFFVRQAVAYKNQLTQSCAELLGITEGILADGQLVDKEITFLRDWLQRHDAIANEWPGDIIAARVASALADGVVTPDERTHLIETLRQLLGGQLDKIAETPRIAELALDDVAAIDYTGRRFCLTGNFAYGPKARCEQIIHEHGGEIAGVTKKLDYLIVGGLGSDEWKHGSFGTKIDAAMKFKKAGIGILIVHENRWAAGL